MQLEVQRHARGTDDSEEYRGREPPCQWSMCKDAHSAPAPAGCPAHIRHADQTHMPRLTSRAAQRPPTSARTAVRAVPGATEHTPQCPGAVRILLGPHSPRGPFWNTLMDMTVPHSATLIRATLGKTMVVVRTPAAQCWFRWEQRQRLQTCTTVSQSVVKQVADRAPYTSGKHFRTLFIIYSANQCVCVDACSNHDHGASRVGTLLSQEQTSKGIMSQFGSSCSNVLVWKCAPAFCTVEVVDWGCLKGSETRNRCHRPT